VNTIVLISPNRLASRAATNPENPARISATKK
jgi:hypothetical protein